MYSRDIFKFLYQQFTNHLTIFHFSASFQHRFRSVGILALALGSILHTRLSLPQPTVLFSTADNPTAKIGSRWTRFLTFAYLPVFNFRLLLYPDVLSFDWGMDAIPRISTLFDGKNVLSAAFYGGLAVALWINVQTLLRQSVPNVNSSFSRKLASKLVMARSNGGPEEQQRIDDSCRYCKHEFGMHHSNQCRAMHNNNSMSSIICGCVYPSCKYLSLSPSSLTSYLHRMDDQKLTAPAATGNGYWAHKKQHCWNRDKHAAANGFSSDHLPFSISRTSSSSSSSSSSSLSSSSSSSSSSTTSSASSMSSLSYDDVTAKFNSSAAILISTSLLILPFLPATNVLFYVGFVVAERILYLPSVGYCLLIGLGVSKLIDGKPQTSVGPSSRRSGNSGGLRAKSSKSFNGDGDRYKYRANGSTGQSAKHHKSHSSNPTASMGISGGSSTTSATAVYAVARKRANNSNCNGGGLVEARRNPSGGVGRIRSGGNSSTSSSRSGSSGGSGDYQQRKRQIILGCFVALLLVYSGKTLLRNLDWQDEESLFRSAISVNPPKGKWSEFLPEGSSVVIDR